MLSALLLFGCAATHSSASKENSVPYATAKNYFVKNTVNVNGAFKITSQSQLDSLFGIARTMSENSQPTPINFDQAFAIAVIAPVADNIQQVKVLDLYRKSDSLHLEYQIEKGKNQSFSSRTFRLLVIDKQYDLPLLATGK